MEIGDYLKTGAVTGKRGRVGYGSPPVEHRFQPGASGNPAGRPKGLARRVREAVGDEGEALVAIWTGIASGYVRYVDPESGDATYERVSVADRLAASKILAERGWGKTAEFVPVEDADPLDLGDKTDKSIADGLRTHIRNDPRAGASGRLALFSYWCMSG